MAYTLNNLSTSRAYRWDLDGSLELLARAAEIASSERSPELLRVLNNQMVVYGKAGRLVEHDEALAQFEQLAQHLGDVASIRFTRGSAVPWTHYLRGRWDEALKAVDDFIDEAQAGIPHRLVGSCHVLRAQIRGGRGDTAGALGDLDRAAEIVEETGDDFTRGLAKGARALVLLEAGHETEARGFVDGVLVLARLASTLLSPMILFVVHRVGREAELLELVERLPDTPFTRAANLWIAGDIRGAADTYASMERLPTGEGLARLAAGRRLVAQGRQHEAEIELRRAVALFRPMGAQQYVARAEDLLSATATAQPG